MQIGRAPADEHYTSAVAPVGSEYEYEYQDPSDREHRLILSAV